MSVVKAPTAESSAGRTLDVFECAAMRIPSAAIARFNPDFIPPEQERTRIKTARIMAVTICLLMEREFSQITVNEIAEKSRCSITSVYARFRDKDALIPAIQYVISYVYFRELNAVIERGNQPGMTHEAYTFSMLSMFDDLFRTHRFFFKAAMKGENEPFHRHAEEMIVSLANRVHQGLIQLEDARDAKVDSVRFALRVMMSVFRDRAIAGQVMTFPDIAALSRLSTMIVKSNLTTQGLEVTGHPSLTR